ncbi:MAG: glycosyltransferase family 4 protein, partial [Actinomycetota bacterium]|nr:glycosyltransferase family 4 protein [Actinomycetota bacterium]
GTWIRGRRALEDFAPDVMHLHEPLIPGAALYALTTGAAPAIGTFHAAAERSVGYAGAQPILARAAARLTARTAVSDAARGLVARYFPGDYRLTPNGVDHDRFARAEAMDLGPGKHIVFLGRIERRKGLEVLLQALARIPDLDVGLVVAGRGPEERRARSLVTSLMLPVRFLGAITEEEKARLLRAADVFCAPALGGESFGIVLLEAMAAGAPVVCSSLPGFSAVAGRAAVLVEPGDPGLLADALRRVLTDESLARRMRAKSAEVSAGFDWGRLVANVEDIYERTLRRA